jgi:hypothetical protein
MIRVSRARLRRHLADAGDLAELRSSGAATVDAMIGARRRAGGGDRDGREIDLWQRRHRQVEIGDQTGQREADGQQRGADWGGG